MRTVIAELSTKLRGWRQYFRLAEPHRFKGLDGWIRRRLRALQLKQWKTPGTIDGNSANAELTTETAGRRTHIANATGRWREDGECTAPSRTKNSTAWACSAWPREPQLAEPPDTDPHVRWCGRGRGREAAPLSR